MLPRALSLILLGVAAVGAGVGLLVQGRRNRRASERADARCEALLAERARLGRELHDELLQRFMGITLQIEGVRTSLQRESSPLAGDLSRILDQADEILREAREMMVRWAGSPPAACPPKPPT